MVMANMESLAIEESPLIVVERIADERLVVSETTETLVFELASAEVAGGKPVGDVVSAEVVLGNDVEGPVSTVDSALVAAVAARDMAAGCMSRLWASGSMKPGLDRSIGAWRKVYEIATNAGKSDAFGVQAATVPAHSAVARPRSHSCFHNDTRAHSPLDRASLAGVTTQ